MVRKLLHKGLFSAALDNLQQRAAAFSGENFAERIEACRTEFRYMSDFMLQGYRDERRETLFADLQHRLISIDYDIRVRSTLLENPYVKSWAKRLATSDTSPEALQSLLLATENDATTHYDAISLAFMALFTSYHWRTQQAEEWAMFLAAPGTSYIVAATLTSAIATSLMQNFSRQKALCLAMIYKNSNNEAVRQRALTGCILGLSYARIEAIGNGIAPEEETGSILDMLFQDAGTSTAVIELYMQMARCANAKSDATEINNNIMPTLLKNQPFRVTREGIVERDEEAEERKDPDSTYKGLDAMEEGVKKMLDMQKHGADIFFGGFKQMKRYPFFYKLTNWFMPFYSAHPDLAKEMEKIGHSEFVEKVTKRGPFCDSDKYSFTIAMASVISSLPEKVQKMMEAGEVGPIGMAKEGDENTSPSLLRLQYLQDMYRFHELNPMAPSLRNPFATIGEYDVWQTVCHHFSAAEIYDVCKYIMRHEPGQRQYEIIEKMLECIDDKNCVEYLQCYGDIMLARQDYAKAMEYYEKCMVHNVNNPVAMRGIARSCYATGEYEKAAFYFDALHTLYPKRNSYLLNYIMAMVRKGKAGDILNELYRLEYENPEDDTIRNTLGWTLLYDGKAEKALATYLRFSMDKVSADYSIALNYAYAHIANGKTKEAVDALCAYRQQHNGNNQFHEMILESMTEDAELLSLYNIGRTECIIIADCIAKKS